MSSNETNGHSETTPPETARWKVIGPGLVAAATGVGGADLVATLVAGQRFGYALLWACIVGTIMKIVLVEGVGRYTLATGNTIFHGWRSLGVWTTWYFAPYIVIWGFVYGAAGTSGVALPLSALFPGVDLKIWAVVAGLITFALAWFGRYRFIEKLMSFMVLVMFLTVVGIATLSLKHLPEILTGLVPTLPENSFIYVLSLAGGIGGTITLAAYGYWFREKGWHGPQWMNIMRWDNTVAYVVTGIFVISMLIIGGDLLYNANIAVRSQESGLLDLATVLQERYGTVVCKIYLIGFLAAAFSSILGVWNGVSLMFADYIGHLKQLPQDHHDVHVGGKYFRFYVLWLTFPPMLLHFLGKPTFLILSYGVLGAFFMPFLGLTLLLLLNTKHTPQKWRNGWFVNTLMIIISALFIMTCVNELTKVFAG
ncbi:divalent metal cation transporter [Corynebacterium poyangense]|uniref:Divalent metal cation transporter n=1 Tax=Corynebacterium poyangense TaxID=2684405 RepID=A0A7H0SMH6_9CORY|nr:Nramp family divalent metal transporter [Corynebacterium poyangense]MBZ8176854.1 divalent metal cation transporter [Corynebacterium poyangense]QNQ89751.1 divalent metal cation transporter [Corynebacterium poyangense]